MPRIARPRVPPAHRIPLMRVAPEATAAGMRRIGRLIVSRLRPTPAIKRAAGLAFR